MLFLLFFASAFLPLSKSPSESAQQDLGIFIVREINA